MGSREAAEIKALWTVFVAKQGEAEFYALYRLFFPYLLTVGLQITDNRDEVKDALSQQFMQIWEQRHQLQHITHPLTYITTSFKRRLFKQNTTEQPLTDEHLHIHTSPSPELLHVRRESDQLLQQQMNEAISRLPERKQQLIRLKYYQGLSYTEIARVTGLSERTIYNKVHEAVKELRKELIDLS